MLHLAFSVFVFSPSGDLLLQRRALSKYHFPGVWANTCCSHPGPGENIVESAERRLAEELGLRRGGPSWEGDGGEGENREGEGELVLLGPLARAGRFIYRAECERSGLVEHELDEVLVGRGAPGSMLPRFDPLEVEELRWAAIDDVRGLGEREGFAPWFAEALGLALAVM